MKQSLTVSTISTVSLSCAPVSGFQSPRWMTSAAAWAVCECGTICSSDIVRDRVFISTVHKAKGLEFDNVIVTSVIDGTYPFFKNHDKADILEDAPKLYVAISRTKRTLVLTMPAANAWNYAQRPSRFLESISTYFEKSSA